MRASPPCRSSERICALTCRKPANAGPPRTVASARLGDVAVGGGALGVDRSHAEGVGDPRRQAGDAVVGGAGADRAYLLEGRPHQSLDPEALLVARIVAPVDLD